VEEIEHALHGGRGSRAPEGAEHDPEKWKPVFGQEIMQKNDSLNRPSNSPLL
jgi:hypothetical protein